MTNNGILSIDVVVSGGIVGEIKHQCVFTMRPLGDTVAVDLANVPEWYPALKHFARVFMEQMESVAI
jgi:hypothetical protein